MAIVVIDPGHGGLTTIGDSSPNNAVGPTGLLEKDVVLDIARMAHSKLLLLEVEAYLTRNSDKNLGLKDRAHIARDLDADAFVSIHLNTYNRKSQGTETWHDLRASSDSINFAHAVQVGVLKATGLQDREVKAGETRNSFGVLNPSHHANRTAACLVEISFLDVPDEEERLRDSGYKENIAAAIASGVVTWLTLAKRI